MTEQWHCYLELLILLSALLEIGRIGSNGRWFCWNNTWVLVASGFCSSDLQPVVKVRIGIATFSQPSAQYAFMC